LTETSRTATPSLCRRTPRLRYNLGPGP